MTILLDVAAEVTDRLRLRFAISNRSAQSCFPCNVYAAEQTWFNEPHGDLGPSRGAAEVWWLGGDEALIVQGPRARYPTVPGISSEYWVPTPFLSEVLPGATSTYDLELSLPAFEWHANSTSRTQPRPKQQAQVHPDGVRVPVWSRPVEVRRLHVRIEAWIGGTVTSRMDGHPWVVVGLEDAERRILRGQVDLPLPVPLRHRRLYDLLSGETVSLYAPELSYPRRTLPPEWTMPPGFVIPANGRIEIKLEDAEFE